MRGHILGRRLGMALVLASGATLASCSSDLVPARVTRPEDVAQAVAAEDAKRAAALAELNRILAKVMIMSGDSNRPYEALGPITSSGQVNSLGFVFGGYAISQSIETAPFDSMKLEAHRQFGDRADAVIGVVCQGLTCTGTAVEWRE